MVLFVAVMRSGCGHYVVVLKFNEETRENQAREREELTENAVNRSPHTPRVVG